MQIGSILVSVLFGLLRALFTEKVLTNLVVILASWLVKRTSNDLDDQIVDAIKDGLDKQGGQPAGNLYDRVKTSAGSAAGR